MTDLLERIDADIAAWEARPESWVPGDPLYEDPRERADRFELDGDLQWVRAMAEVLEPKPVWEARCRECDTWWTGDAACFMCGVKRPPIRRPLGMTTTRVANWFAVPFESRVTRTRHTATVLVTIDLAPFRQALIDFGRQMATMLADVRPVIERLSKALEPSKHDEHHPPPLPINGREYARRRRSR